MSKVENKVENKLNLNAVGRVCVTVSDTDRAVDFYVGTLGFEKVVDLPMGPGMRWVEVAIGDSKTTIALAPPPEGKEAGGAETGIILDTSDVEADHAALEGRRCRRGRRDQPVRRPGAPDVLAARSRPELADHRPAHVVALVVGRGRSDRPAPSRLTRGGRSARLPALRPVFLVEQKAGLWTRRTPTSPQRNRPTVAP